MAFEYTQNSAYENPVNTEQCKASVMKGFQSRQCSRWKWSDGWCRQHHPAIISKRNKKSQERYNAKIEARPYAKIRKLETALLEISSYPSPPQDFKDWVFILDTIRRIAKVALK